MELKFRVWDRTNNMMHQVKNINFTTRLVTYEDRKGTQLDDGGFYPINTIEKISDTVLMQYIGLQDINGIDIYEGDLIEINDVVWRVGFSDGLFCLISDHDEIHPYSAVDGIVIGNIYQGQKCDREAVQALKEHVEKAKSVYSGKFASEWYRTLLELVDKLS